MLTNTQQLARIQWRAAILAHPGGPAWLAGLVRKGAPFKALGPNLIPPWAPTDRPPGSWWWPENRAEE